MFEALVLLLLEAIAFFFCGWFYSFVLYENGKVFGFAMGTICILVLAVALIGTNDPYRIFANIPMGIHATAGLAAFIFGLIGIDRINQSFFI